MKGKTVLQTTTVSKRGRGNTRGEVCYALSTFETAKYAFGINKLTLTGKVSTLSTFSFSSLIFCPSLTNVDAPFVNVILLILLYVR